MENIKQLDTETTRRIARKMTMDCLRWSAKDAWEAAQASEELERAGCRVDKTGGYYRDEAAVYRTEIRRREAK